MFPRELRQRRLNRSTHSGDVQPSGPAVHLTLESLEARTMMSAAPGTLDPAFAAGTGYATAAFAIPYSQLGVRNGLRGEL